MNTKKWIVAMELKGEQVLYVRIEQDKSTDLAILWI